MLLLGFMAAAAYGPGLASAAYAPRWWVILVLAPWLVSRCPELRWTTGHWLGISALFASALSLIWSFSPVDTVHHLVLMAGLACAFLVGAETDDLYPLWRGLVLGLIPSVPIALAQLAGYRPVESYGIDGLFLNRNVYAVVGAVTLIGLVGSVWRRRLVLGRVDAGLIMVAAFTALAPASRSVYAALALVLIWLLAPRSWRFWGLLGGLVAIAGLLLIDGLDPSRLLSMEYRTQFWRLTLANLSWLGTGLGTYPEIWPYGNAHNEALELIFELGVLALPFFLLAWYALEAPLRLERVALSVLLLTSMLNAHLHAPVPALVAAVLLGRLCRARADLRAARSAGGGVYSAGLRPGPAGRAAGHL